MNTCSYVYYITVLKNVNTFFNNKAKRALCLYTHHMEKIINYILIILFYLFKFDGYNKLITNSSSDAIRYQKVFDLILYKKT